MAVPGHDERDFEFAKKYTLPVRQVIAPIVHGQQGESVDISPGSDQSMDMKEAFTEYGVLVSSGEWRSDKNLPPWSPPSANLAPAVAPPKPFSVSILVFCIEAVVRVPARLGNYPMET